jgi:hypothetical protein
VLRAGAKLADGSDRARVRAASVSPDCRDHAGARVAAATARAGPGENMSNVAPWEVVVEMTREGQCARGAAREAGGAGRDDI